VAEGVLQMKGVYQAGVDCYRKQDFAKAIRYFKKSLEIHDPYTPKFYYAEANAMLGVIYQFNIIDKPTAYEYYRAALDIDPTTRTAKKHIGEVSDEKSSKRN
jgi:tetratricopeptide (TPR) repeat protein